MDLFKSFNIPIENLIAFASDNASVMVGKKGGVQALLKKDVPNLFVLGCVCHSMHLCSSAASKHIPRYVEKLARNINSYFCHSAKRVSEFKELQELFNVKTHKLLKTSSTRWLSLEQVIKRILEQWEPLTHYFRVCETEDDQSDIGSEIYKTLSNSEAKVYFLFMAYVLKEINHIHTEFQAEKPRLHLLLKTTKSFLHTMMVNFVKEEIVDNTTFDKNEYRNPSALLPVDDIYIGAKAKKLVVASNMPRSVLREIQKCCRNFYIELCDQVLSRINMNDPVLAALEIIDPQHLGTSIVPLLIQFENLLPANADEDDIDIEWRNCLHQQFVDKANDLSEFWPKVFELKNGSGEYMYPNLKIFVGSILALPHSSACAERIFSKVTLIKSKLRNKLEVPTVNAIMLSAGLIDNCDAHRWFPSKELIN